MLVLSCSMKLQMLEKMLRWSFPESLKVYGAVMNINRGNPFRKEVVVDSWPDFKAVITRPRREWIQNPERICQSWRMRDWKSNPFHYPVLLNMSLVLLAFLNVFSTLPIRNKAPLEMDPKLMLAYLDISHASLLSKTWSRGGNRRSQKYLSNLICCFPSVCVLDGNGYPLSWSLTDQFATMIHSYTLPQHRRKGYSRLVATTLAKKLHSCGFPAQG
ncbi:GLYL3 protein, partial [Nyctibius grandis]|nr:GLYL3 protein [Nyctibius grandis]